MSAEEQAVWDIIGPVLQRAGFTPVRAKLSSNGEGRTLQVMAEPADGRTMLVDDCAMIDALLEPALDAANVVSGAYRLEVSSPGIDRPLMQGADFVRYKGFEARVELAEPLEGRKRFRGRIVGVAGDAAELVVDNKTVLLPLEAIAQAQLVLTDDLIKAHQKQDKKAS